ncbi:MAG: nuclear transport factor 2 family protein [Candidatus Acidiferrales bacterium]
MRQVGMQLLFSTLLVSFFSVPLHAQDEDRCQQAPLLNQRRDGATIQRLENAWTIAYLHADMDFERCLLAPDFTEIMRTGEIKFLADELALAMKNRGKNLPTPDLPEATVLLHGDVAVAYGTSHSTGSDGRTRTTRYADYYLWEKGRWHAFFAQQTSVENESRSSARLRGFHDRGRRLQRT